MKQPENINSLQNTISHASDEGLRAKLEAHHADVPADMFERVQAARNTRRHRPFAFWWTRRGMALAAIVLLFTTVCGVWVAQKYTTPTVATASDTSVEKNSIAAKTETNAMILPEMAAQQSAKTGIAMSPKAHSPKKHFLTTLPIEAIEAIEVQKAVPQSVFNTEPIGAANTDEVAILTVENNVQKPNLVSKTDLMIAAPLPLRDGSLPLVQLKVFNVTDPCPTFVKSFWGKSNWYLDAYVAPEYGLRSLGTNGEKTQLSAVRDSGERSWYAFSTGIRASFQTSKGWIIRAGVNYGQQNEIATYDVVAPPRTRTITVTETINGITTTTTKTEITKGIDRTTAYNRYRTLDVPLQIGFGRTINAAWQWAVYGGAAVNITSFERARILSISDTVRLADVSAGLGESSPVFNNSIGVSLLFNAAAYYQLADRWQLSIEPQLRYELGSWTRGEYPLTQRYLRVGVLVGLRYRL